MPDEGRIGPPAGERVGNNGVALKRACSGFDFKGFMSSRAFCTGDRARGVGTVERGREGGGATNVPCAFGPPNSRTAGMALDAELGRAVRGPRGRMSSSNAVFSFSPRLAYTRSRPGALRRNASRVEAGMACPYRSSAATLASAAAGGK